MAADVMKMSSAKAVSGDTIAIVARNGGVMVDNAQVVKTDIAASNGVIHVIDAVILPKEQIGFGVDASILLTGATGYIGGRLLRRLEEGGHAVRCLARQPAQVALTSADHRSRRG